MHLGVVDLDTSHPGAFHPLLIERGHRVVALADGQDVVTPEYVRQYAGERSIPHILDGVDELIEAAPKLGLDAVFVHSVNWDRHLDRIEALAAAGLPVQVCKPFAGRVEHLRRLQALVAGGARITGGSALRWSATALAARETAPRRAYAATFGHPLDYGIHAHTLVSSILGPGIEAARALDDTGRLTQLRWQDGRDALVDVQPTGAGYGFTATTIGDGGVHQFDATGDDLYGPFLDATCDILTGEGQGPSLDTLIEPDLAAIASKASAQHGGRWVRLDDDATLADGSFDPTEFVTGYAATRRESLGLSAV